MISIENLVKQYDDKTILKDVSFSIPKSSFFGIIGESGAGKSTLLKCINRLEDFDQGKIVVDDFDVKSLSDKELRNLRHNIGMIFQNFGLLEQKSVHNNISLPLELMKFEKKYIEDRVYELAKLVGVEDHLHKKPKQLSGGQKQRVAIARALSANPDYLLCDECTSALDPKNAVMIMKLLRKIQDELGVTIVLVTHDMLIAKAFCDNIAILRDGQLIDIGYTEDIVSRNSLLFTNDYTKEEYNV